MLTNLILRRVSKDLLSVMTSCNHVLGLCFTMQASWTMIVVKVAGSSSVLESWEWQVWLVETKSVPLAEDLAREMSSFRNCFVSALMRSFPLFKYPNISGICEQKNDFSYSWNFLSGNQSRIVDLSKRVQWNRCEHSSDQNQFRYHFEVRHKLHSSKLIRSYHFICRENKSTAKITVHELLTKETFL